MNHDAVKASAYIRATKRRRYAVEEHCPLYFSNKESHTCEKKVFYSNGVVQKGLMSIKRFG